MSKVSNSSAAPAYENNPFYVAIQGIELLFNKAKGVGIFLAILAGLSLLGSIPSSFMPATDPAPVTETTMNQPVLSDEELAAQNEADWNSFTDSIKQVPVEAWLIIALIVLVILAFAILVGFVINGIMDYTSAQLAAGKEVTFSEAFKATFAGLWGYAWVMLLAGIKTFLWSLLFIIPGIIMAVRYSLAGTAYFATGKKGNEAIKHSLALTQGAWLTTNASQFLLPFITFGAAGGLFTPGTKAVLYRQLDAVTAKNEAKPAAHILSWLVLILPLVLLGLLALLVLLLIAAFANYAGTL